MQQVCYKRLQVGEGSLTTTAMARLGVGSNGTT